MIGADVTGICDDPDTESTRRTETINMSHNVESLEVTTAEGHVVDLAPLIRRARALEETIQRSKTQYRPDSILQSDNPDMLGAMILGMRVSVVDLFGEDAGAMFDERIGISPPAML